MPDENSKLVKRLKKKEEQALEQIMKRFTPLVASIVHNIAKGSLTTEDIEEVVTDVFVTLWRNAEKVQEDKLKAYLCCIAKTRTYNKLDTVKRAVIVDIDEIDVEDEFSLSETAEQNDLNACLLEIIDTIPEPDREILLRHYFYYQTVTDIAQRLQLNAETVKGKLFRTRKKIKSQLMERGYAR